MAYDPHDERLSEAEERLVRAERMIAAGRMRDALDLLNAAIQLAPYHSPLFATRAGVFERLGMAPQAEADRRLAEDIAARYGIERPAPTEAIEPEPEPEGEQAIPEPEPESAVPAGES